jgi:hypothetical protein
MRLLDEAANRGKQSNNALNLNILQPPWQFIDINEAIYFSLI